MEQHDSSQSTYVPLSLVPQPSRHPRPGQLGLKPAKASVPHSKAHEATKTSKQHVFKPDSVAAKRLLKDKYHISSDSEDTEPKTCSDAASSTAEQPSVTQLQRQHVLQHLSEFKQRAAAIKSTAEAVQEWYECGGPAAATAAAVLPAEALLVLNAEADRGLLHMLDTGLVPAQLELTPGLCGRPDAPLYSKPTQLHSYEAKLAATPHRIMEPVWHTRKAPAAAAIEPAAAKAAAPSTQAPQAAVIEARGQPAAGAAPAAPAATAAQPRGYEELLDALSEHQLLIFRGKLVQDTPQVSSFICTAAPLWTTVSVLLSQLEAVCRVFKVPLAVVDGQEVLQLAQSLQSTASSTGNSISAEDAAVASEQVPAEACAVDAAKPALGLPDLLCCIANLDELEHLFTSVTDDLVAAALTGGEAAASTSSNPPNPAVEDKSPSAAALHAATAAEGSEQPAPSADVPAASTATSTGQAKPQAKLQKVEEPLLQTMVQARRDRDSAFQLLQSALRHHWQDIQQQPHVVLHLPSLPAWAVRHTAQRYSESPDTQPCQEQHQMWRLLSLADQVSASHGQGLATSTIRSKATGPAADSVSSDLGSSKAIHVLVTSRVVSKQLQSHWMQLLKMAGMAEPSNHVRFVCISASESKAAGLPASLPLAAHLMASEKALRRCKQIITGHRNQEPVAASNSSDPTAYAPETSTAAAATRPNQQRQQVPPGYIMLGCPCEHDVDVAVKLGLPMLGPTPLLAQVLGSKIGARSLFAAAGIRVAPGGVLPRRAHNCSDEGAWQQLLAAMCLQLLRWPAQQQWMVKLNQARGTAGLAVLDLAVMQETQAAVAAAIQQLQLQQQPSGPSQDPWEPLSLSGVATEQLQLVLQQLLPALAGELHLALQLAQQAYWEGRAADAGYSATVDDIAVAEAAVELYLTELLHQGGVMEMLLDQLVCCPLVQLLIEPAGIITVIATQDKILHGGFNSPGSTFPSSCPEHAALVQAGTAAGEAARAAGMLGHLQVSFLCTTHPPRTSLQQQQTSEAPINAAGAAEPLNNNREAAASEVLLWGCGLLPWSSPDLALFTLFDAVHQGSFDTVAGQYLVTEQCREPESEQQEQLQKQEPRLPAGKQQVLPVEEQVVQQVQQRHYACLHSPATVSPSQHLRGIMQNSWLKPDAQLHHRPGNSGPQGTLQRSQPRLHDFATSGEVIVCIDSSSHDSISQKVSHDQSFLKHGEGLAGSSTSDQGDAEVSGVICCSRGSSVVGALSCLSALIAKYDRT